VDTVPETDPQNLSIYSYFPTSVFLGSLTPIFAGRYSNG
jgi:hypothetical protein